MKVTRILHATVNAQGDLQGTRRFYAEVLGLEPAERPEIPGLPGFFFAVGDAQVHIVGAPPTGEAIDPTGNHYCLAVDDIEAAAAELEAGGIRYVRGAQGPNDEVTQIWIVDPAGSTVELQQDRPL
jgi:catechol 2,3-dioxygenase-like lactoylglutathione lyase family enzyme